MILLTLEGCSNVYKESSTKIDADHSEITNTLKRQSEGELYTNRKLNMIADFTYQPAWLKKQISLKSKRIPFKYVMNKIAKKFGINIIYGDDLAQLEINDFNFKGSVKDVLTYLMRRTNYAYDVDGDIVRWSQFAVKTYDVTFLPGETNFQVGGKISQSEGSAGSGDDAGQSRSAGSDYANEFVEVKGQGSIWSDIEKTIESLLSPDGNMTVSRSLTSVTVRDRPSHLEAITRFLDQVNKRLSQQVLIKVTVLEVALSKEYAHGINWNKTTRTIAKSGRVGFDATGKVMMDSTSIFSAAHQNINSEISQDLARMAGNAYGMNISLLIKCLEEQGDVSVSTQPTVVTLNNQVAQVKITNEKGYLAKSEVSTNGTTTTTAITPGLVSSGMTMYLLPKIFKNKIYLQLSSSLSQLNDLVEHTVSSGTNATVNLSTPVLSAKNFNQRVIIRSGDTLILSGFKQVNSTRGALSPFGISQLGGKSATSNVVETIMLVTPYLSDHDRPNSKMIGTPTISKATPRR